MWKKKHPKKEHRIGDIEIHKLREYMVTGIGILIIGLILDLDFAFIFLGMYLVMPLLSIGAVLMTVTKLEITLQSEKTVMEKEEHGKVLISVTNHGLLPILGLEVRMREDYHLKSIEKKRYTLSLGGKGSISYYRKYEAVMWGQADLKLECALITDVFGFVSFSINMEDHSQSLRSIKIVPRIPKVLMEKEIMDTWFSANKDAEDRGENPNQMEQKSTVLGYEYKEYQPGDSLKRIHWKLSEKKGIYLVRLEENQAYAPPSFILDCYVDRKAWNYGGHKERMYAKQRIVEGLLGTIREFIEIGIGCELCYSLKGNVQRLQVNTMEKLGELQWSLASFQFEEQVESLPEIEEVQKSTNGLNVIFTIGMNQRLCGQIEEARHQGNQSIVVVAEENSISTSYMFCITKGFELQRITL